MKTKSTLFCLLFAFFANTYSTVHAQAVNKQDSLALVDLYNSTDGPNWRHKENWLTKGSVKNWFGITVMGTRVVYISLCHNQLKGAIPASIGNLVNLYYLKLSFNHLSGTIPASIGNLVNLEELFMDNNELSGNIPSSIGKFANLQYLYLSNNQISGGIPASIGNLVNLTELFLDANQLSGSIPSSLSNLVNLNTLHLDHNKLSGDIHSSFTNLSSLDELDLSHNRFTFNSMQFIQNTFPFAIYAPQALIPVHQHGNTLAVSLGGTLKNNTYKWFRVGQAGNTTIGGDSVFHPSQNGMYFVSVTNSIAIKLTLTSDTISYTAPSLLNTAVLASSEDAQQAQNKTSFFLVYPNPAKDILHVQTNGKASFSLLSQSGQGLLNANINKEGSINISNMAAGLYYLRNNSTGAVQKVIITR